jgi:adenylate cyclase
VFCLCAVAEIHTAADRVEEALGALRSIPADARGAFYAPEIHRIEGEVLLRRTLAAAREAEGHFHAAMDLARARAEKSLELRAATSLARLWQRENRGDDARSVLTDILGWFTEGFTTTDVRNARHLLQELA